MQSHRYAREGLVGAWQALFSQGDHPLAPRRFSVALSPLTLFASDSMPDSFAALPGFYRLVFLYIEPLSTFIPFLFVWIAPGAQWFFQEQIPYDVPASAPLDDRTRMVISQLVNCYMLLGLLSSVVFRAVRDTLPNNPAAQERILGASLLALAIADATHVLATFIELPENIRFSPQNWNPMTHGNITATTLYLVTRVAWFMGIGRTRFYFGQKQSQRAKVT